MNHVNYENINISFITAISEQYLYNKYIIRKWRP